MVLLEGKGRIGWLKSRSALVELLNQRNGFSSLQDKG